MKYDTIYQMQKHTIYGHYPVNYDKIVKGAMDTLWTVHYSTVPYEFRELISVWKPQDKGICGQNNIRHRSPVQQRRA